MKAATLSQSTSRISQPVLYLPDEPHTVERFRASGLSRLRRSWVILSSALWTSWLVPRNVSRLCLIGYPAWKTAVVAGVAGPVDLLGVSCPSTGECIGIDRSGDIVSSIDPESKAPQWTVANVVDVNGPPYPTPDLMSVDCPTSLLCVAADATGDVITSSDPTGGAGAWTVSHVDQGTTYECEHYGGRGVPAAFRR